MLPYNGLAIVLRKSPRGQARDPCSSNSDAPTTVRPVGEVASDQAMQVSPDRSIGWDTTPFEHKPGGEA